MSTLPACCSVPVTKPPFRRRVGEAIGALIGVSLLTAVVWPFISRFTPSVSANSSLIGLFLFGVVASVSTCLASTGAFMVAYASSHNNKRTLVGLHAGRLAAFLVGGALLGGLGASIPGSSTWYGGLALVLGTGFLFVGLHLLGLAPSLASLGVRLPTRLTIMADRVANHPTRFSSLLVGAATFLLPCGFTQTAQALTLVSGSSGRGALMMGAFALGTLPVLLGVTLFSSGTILRHRAVQLVTGALLIMFALGQFDGGLTVLGSRFTLSGFLAQGLSWFGEKTVPTVSAREQVISMTVAYGAFTPNRFVVRRGIPVIWQIEGVDIAGCADTILAPTLGIRKSLQLGANEIQFTPKNIGSIPFSCSMGMIRGSFQVVE